MRLKQLFCRHEWKFIVKNSIVCERLSQCKKCNIFEVLHTGIHCRYKTAKWPNNIGWEVVNEAR